MNTRTPALFISHGSPMFAVEPGLLGPNLTRLGQSLDAVKAIVVLSPHWMTINAKVTATQAPETIHDFGGFPEILYTLQYNPPGAPELAARTLQLLNEAGIPTTADPDRGLDHGAWVPLRYVKPQADIPVIQVSTPRALNPQTAFEMGRALRPLRDEGILLIGSGSLTHNLYEFRQHINDPEYAQQFADWVHTAVRKRDIPALIDYRATAPYGARAHPTEEHYIPLLFAAGAAHDDEAGSIVEGGMTYGTLSMDSFRFG